MLINYFSSLNVIRRHDWDVGRMARELRTFDGIPGSRESIGIPSKPKNANLPSSQMFVVCIHSQVLVAQRHFLQMKQANFDVSHELDEFLMVEKPLTHSRRKVNPDLDKMKPELRQLEEQYAPSKSHLHMTY
jgi:hypothetical protein